MSETFREWLERERGEKDKFVLVSKVIKEFDRWFMERPIVFLDKMKLHKWLEEEQTMAQRWRRQNNCDE